MKLNVIRGLRPVLAAITGLGLGLSLTAFAGENPLAVAGVLFRGVFSSSYDFGMTLFYSTPLIFTGIAVSIAWHAGLFNIGAEGQLTMGALTAAAVGISFPNVSPWLAPALAVAAGVLMGGLWAAIAAWMRVRRGSHEVITTILLNFIASGIASWVTLYPLHNVHSQNPETAEVGRNYLLTRIPGFDDAPVSTAMILALVVTIAAWFVLNKTVWGFQLQAVGQNERAANASGISVNRIRFWALCASGAVAGLVAAPEILGNAGRFRFEFSPGYGFIGIAVAILARGQPFAILPAAFMFAALQKGSLDLDVDTDHVTRELSMVLQGLVILFVAAEGLWSFKRPQGKAARA